MAVQGPEQDKMQRKISYAKKIVIDSESKLNTKREGKEIRVEKWREKMAVSWQSSEACEEG